MRGFAARVRYAALPLLALGGGALVPHSLLRVLRTAHRIKASLEGRQEKQAEQQQQQRRPGPKWCWSVVIALVIALVSAFPAH